MVMLLCWLGVTCCYAIQPEQVILNKDTFYIYPTAYNGIGLKVHWGLTDGKYICYYEGMPNKIAFRINVANGTLDGQCEGYYLDGKTMVKSNYIDGVVHGRWEWYYENGNLDGVENWVMGSREGKWELWRENGLLEMEGYYKTDRKHGTWIWYYPTGTIMHKQFFKNGEREKKSITWDRNGNKQKQRTLSLNVREP